MHNGSQVLLAVLAGATSHDFSAALVLNIHIHFALCMVSRHAAQNTSAQIGAFCML